MLRQFRFGLILASLLAVLTASAVFAQDFPQPTGNLVNDFAGLLSPAGKAQLESRLLQLEKDTTDEVAVVTIASLEGDSVEDYASRLFEKWGIGKKGKDNGVLFLVAPTERQMWIEVGYGLEPVLTDGRAGRILDNEVLPSFRDGDYEAGITKGVIAIEGYLRKGTPPTALEENPVRRVASKADFLPSLLIGLGIVTVYLAGFMARSKKSIWLGGIWGFVMGAVLGLVTGGLLGLILFPIGLTGLGLLLDLVLSRNYRALKSTEQSTGWANTWGGFRGPYGGFGGGFGGGGGGFHFGGGMSGGGGAGRGW
ncbi:MAG: hypothetical protein A2Z28_05140 [Chloroflexi bacterium RBG_16_51_9]|nr:MAG: hypothetical protein A2Z28_05140 [Chloroflexi bacterium RBG_16_51_9]